MSKIFKFNKICLAAILFLFSFFAVPQNTFASSAQSTIYGVDVTVTTDKDEYDFGETINVQITLKNNNPYNVQVENVISAISIPGIDLGEVEFPATLSAGEEVTKSVSGVVTAGFEQWKTVDVNGQSISVGIRASAGIIEDNSEFLVETIPSGTQEYNMYLNQLDDKDRIERLAFFNLGIKKPNGEFYTDMGKPVTVYIQIPANWDEADLEAVYVSAGVDEQFQENFVNINGIRYLSFRTTHFSPYAVLDFLKDGDISASTTSASEVKTGDTSKWVTPAIVIIALSALIMCIVCGKKIRNKTLALVLCVGTMSFCAMNFNNKALADDGETYFTVSGNVYNTVSVAGQAVTITTTVKLRVVKPTFSMAPQVPVDEDPVLTCSNIPQDWSGRIDIINNYSSATVFTETFTTADIINNRHTIKNTSLDVGVYTLQVYDQYNNMLKEIQFEMIDYS